MFSRAWIEKLDASYGIPRKANEQYLPSFNAFWHWTVDIGKATFHVGLGMVEAVLSLIACRLLGEPGLINLAFWAMALIFVAGGAVDAFGLLQGYRIWHMSTAHGSARWAKI